MSLRFPKHRGAKRRAELEAFAQELQATGPEFKISSRGWGYWLEGSGLISKAEFDRVAKIINECRKENILPLDFVAEDTSRQWRFGERGDDPDPKTFARRCLNFPDRWDELFDPDPWEGRGVYIQMLVEKIDLVELFSPICEVFRIPIATASGWSDLNERGMAIQRWSRMEIRGNRPVLLYCGDHDPAGLQISNFLKKNFMDLKNSKLEKMYEPWNPENLVIDRFGLNYDFIREYHLTWVDNLITGSGKDLASPKHKDHFRPYVQEYLGMYGVRKVEANAIMRADTIDAARKLCVDAIEKYIGVGAFEVFKEYTKKKRAELKAVFESIGLYDRMAELETLLGAAR